MCNRNWKYGWGFDKWGTYATTGTTDPDSLSPISVGDAKISIATLTVENADVDSGKVIIAYVENVGGTDDVTGSTSGGGGGGFSSSEGVSPVNVKSAPNVDILSLATSIGIFWLLVI